MVIRAVHLELVEDMSVRSILHTFHHFVSQRGHPTTVNSDNAVTLKWSKRELLMLWNGVHSEVVDVFANKDIHWKFIVEQTPW